MIDSSQKSLDPITRRVQWESFMPSVSVGSDQKKKDCQDHSASAQLHVFQYLYQQPGREKT